jgi:hypothetical protein
MITREFLNEQRKQLQDRSKVLESQLSEIAGALALCDFLITKLDLEGVADAVTGGATAATKDSSSPEP